jgi:hypothetical protein
MSAVKKPVVNSHFFGETREIVNGHVVKDTVVSYDGKTLKDNQLKTLLMSPISKMSLLERLYGHFTHKRNNTHKHKKRNKKYNKTKRHT